MPAEGTTLAYKTVPAFGGAFFDQRNGWPGNKFLGRSFLCHPFPLPKIHDVG
jgi:hypothetical protein